MRPEEKQFRKLDFGGKNIPIDPLEAEDIQNIQFENGDYGFLKSSPYSTESMGDIKIKIQAMKLAIYMSRLYNEATPQKILMLSDKIAKYIKHGK